MSLADSYRARPRVQFGKYRFLENVDPHATFPALNCCHGSHNSSADSTRSAEELKPIAQLYTKAFGTDDMNDGGNAHQTVTFSNVPSALENGDFDYISHENKSESENNNKEHLKDGSGDVISDEELLISLGNSNPKRLSKATQQRQRKLPPPALLPNRASNDQSHIFTLDEYTAAHLGWAGGKAAKSADLNVSRMRVDMTEEAVIVLESLKHMGRLSHTYLIDIYRGRWKRQVVDQAQRCGHISYPMCNRGNMLSVDDANSFIDKLLELGFLMSEEFAGRYKNKCHYLQITDAGRDFADRKNHCRVIVEMSGRKTAQRKRPADKHINDLMAADGQTISAKLALNAAASVPNQAKLNPAYFPADMYDM